MILGTSSSSYFPYPTSPHWQSGFHQFHMWKFFFNAMVWILTVQTGLKFKVYLSIFIWMYSVKSTYEMALYQRWKTASSFTGLLHSSCFISLSSWLQNQNWASSKHWSRVNIVPFPSIMLQEMRLTHWNLLPNWMVHLFSKLYSGSAFLKYTQTCTVMSEHFLALLWKCNL